MTAWQAGWVEEIGRRLVERTDASKSPYKGNFHFYLLKDPETINAFALVKSAFDPANIFNPGVKVPLPQQTAIGDVKYDPELPPLPEKARQALDAIVKDRAYDRFRLSLIEGSS